MYKEPDLTQLSEVTERLTQLWRRRLRAEVAVITGSRAVEPNSEAGSDEGLLPFSLSNSR